MSRGDAKSNGYDYITNLYGRRLDLIYKPDGTPISPMVLSRTLKYYNQILQWQFVQEAKNIYLLKIILRDGMCVDEACLKRDLLEYLGDLSIIKIEYTKEIPCLSSGKRKAVVNNWKG